MRRAGDGTGRDAALVICVSSHLPCDQVTFKGDSAFPRRCGYKHSYRQLDSPSGTIKLPVVAHLVEAGEGYGTDRRELEARTLIEDLNAVLAPAQVAMKVVDVVSLMLRNWGSRMGVSELTSPTVPSRL